MGHFPKLASTFEYGAKREERQQFFCDLAPLTPGRIWSQPTEQYLLSLLRYICIWSNSLLIVDVLYG